MLVGREVSNRPIKPFLAHFTPSTHRRSAVTGKLSDAARRRCVVGVLDISARAGLLFYVLDRVNRRQQRYQFVPVEAPIPTNVGLMSDRLKRMAIEAGVNQNDPEWPQVDDNVFAPEFYPWLDQILSNFDGERLVGAVGPMLAFTKENGRFAWNYNSISHDRVVMVSTFGVRDYARKAKRPYEACVAVSLVGQLWHSLYGVGYHHETIGCVFDHCYNRDDLVEKYRKVEISAQALDLIPAEAHADILKTLDAIRTYER